MPNYCENDLTIYGPYKELQYFLKGLQIEEDHYLILQTYCPMPEEIEKTTSPETLVDTEEERIARNRHEDEKDSPYKGYVTTRQHQKELIEKYGASNWYDWALGYWGTKWPDLGTSLKRNGKRSLKFAFDTAWSPPVEGLLEISSQFPHLTFKLDSYEGGAAYQYHGLFREGEELEGVTSDYRGRRGG